MTREQIFEVIRAHLADELELDPDSISEGTRFREDLEADSLDLYTLVQELEDTYGVRDIGRGGSQDPHRRTGGGLRTREWCRTDASVCERESLGCPAVSTEAASRQAEAPLRELLDALPEDLARHVFTHASWTSKRADSYERLAFRR